MFSGKGSKRARYLLFLILSFGIITSHYATGYVYILVLSVLALTDYLFGGTLDRHGQIRIAFFGFLLVFCIGFSWYIFTIGPFSQMVSLLSHTVERFNDLFAAPRNLGPIGLSTQSPLWICTHTKRSELLNPTFPTLGHTVICLKIQKKQ